MLVRDECGVVVDEVLRHIKSSFLAEAVGEEGCFGHVEVKSSVLVESVLEISQDLKRHA